MTLNSNNQHFVGLDIGGTNIKFVVLDGLKNTITRGSRPSQASQSSDSVVKVASQIVADLLAEGFGIKRFGVGCAGSVDYKKGVVRTSPNFRGWHNVPLADLLKAATGLECVVENDGNCAAWGEWMCGGSKKVGSLLVLTLGTGIGGGIVTQGRAFRGATSTGPEFGHFSMSFDGPQCACGHRGCFEVFCSGSAILRSTGFQPRDFFSRLSREPVLQNYLTTYLRQLSSGLASLANLFDPDLILLGGGVSHGLEPSLLLINTVTKSLCFPSIAENLKIGFASLDEFSGAIGAALLGGETKE